jgi:hypothetical protein
VSNEPKVSRLAYIVFSLLPAVQRTGRDCTLELVVRFVRVFLSENHKINARHI